MPCGGSSASTGRSGRCETDTDSHARARCRALRASHWMRGQAGGETEPHGRLRGQLAGRHARPHRRVRRRDRSELWRVGGQAASRGGSLPVDAADPRQRRAGRQADRRGSRDRGDSREVIASNQLALIVPHGKLRAHLRNAGRYSRRRAAGHRRAVDGARRPLRQGCPHQARQVDALQDRLVMGGDVAAVLAYARRSEAASGWRIVYRN